MKRSIATPTSASISTWWVSPMSLNPPGPMRIPVSMKPIAAGTLSLRLGRITRSAAQSVTTRS